MRLQTILGVSALIGFVLVSIHYLPVLDRELMDSPRISDFNLRATSGKLKVLRALNEHIDQTNWIVTDMPMYAFRVQRPVPRTWRRSPANDWHGALTEEDILAACAYQPEQVLMARFEIPASRNICRKITP
jgi:hypothetical protein